ncbi:MAG: hypothetical protein ACK5KT_09385 [Dysgonomonas sp.]
MKKLLLSAIVCVALMASTTVMAQDATPKKETKAKTECKKDGETKSCCSKEKKADKKDSAKKETKASDKKSTDGKKK